MPVPQPLIRRGLFEGDSVMANLILSEPFQLKDGHFIISDKPGQGIEWNEKAVAKCTCRIDSIAARSSK
jgi:L-alanine-DL-glutamate epimerase-like enolase superfamily enzyme